MPAKPDAASPDGALARVNGGWLSVPEQRALAWLVPRLPAWLTPDRLTAIGFLGCLLGCAGYLLAPRYPVALWLVNLGLIVNWFGDSTDGRVAQMRGIERPRYGFFLDQSTDAFSQFLFGVALGLSGYVSLEIAAIGLAAYLLMSVQSLLRAEVSRVFALATGGIGLTEVRCLFFLVNVAFYLVPPTPFFSLAGMTLGYGDLLGLVWIAVNLGLYLAAMYATLKVLRRKEPARRPQDR
jgi:archaetidylinositol phosphate synthase